MEIPSIKIGDIIIIGDYPNTLKAEVVRIYTEEQKKSGLCGNIQIVYYQNKIKGIKDDVIWDGKNWKLKNNGPSGTYVNINLYDPRLKN